MVETKYHPGVAGLLSPLAPWLNDAEVSEIMVNQPQQAFVEKHGVMTEHRVEALTEQHLSRLTTLIANESQQRLSEHTPLLSANLYDRSRVQVVLPPVAKAVTLCIRRQVAHDFSLANYGATLFYQHTQSCDTSVNSRQSLSQEDALLLTLYQRHDWDPFIRHAISFKKTIVISGGTSSGKTTFLNACLAHIPAEQRLIVLEDTREIELPHPNRVQLLAFKGEQGMSQVTMQDLVQCSLRLRPDRIIVGEIRGREILDFISAASTGHEGSLTTIHANNPHLAFRRMIQLYKLNNVPAMSDDHILAELHNVIDVIVQLNKTPQGRVASHIYYKHGHFADE